MKISSSVPTVHPVVLMPPWAVTLDLSVPLSQVPDPGTPWTLGRYGEDRGIYTQPLFGGARTVHLGLDLGGPVGTAVHAPLAGQVVHAGHNPEDGDYGHVIVLQCEWQGAPLWVLLGHLSAHSLQQSPRGSRVKPGTVIGWLGNMDENGGWPPHVHVQVSREDPGTHDMPGAAARADALSARARWPDPEALLGRLR